MKTEDIWGHGDKDENGRDKYSLWKDENLFEDGVNEKKICQIKSILIY